MAKRFLAELNGNVDAWCEAFGTVDQTVGSTAPGSGHPEDHVHFKQLGPLAPSDAFRASGKDLTQL